MAIKHIPAAWKAKLVGESASINNKVDFYLNPRGRVFPALTSAGISYIKNTAADNHRGTYRMQCGASTSLTHLYTLPQRFILEGWFKPEFAYNVGAYQHIFSNTAASAFDLYYDYTVDKIGLASIPGTTIFSTAFTSDAELQKWIYVRCFFDNVAKLKGFYCTVEGVVYADSQNVPGAGTFTPLNTISFMPTVAAESSYWVIHELDETLATGAYKTYQADRQIMFDFNGTTLGRERIRIPRSTSASDLRGVKSYSISKSIAKNGSAGANTASFELYNFKGQFSDDQYDAFNPFNGDYNGTLAQKYLQNRVSVEIEIQAPSVVSANDYQGYVEPIFIGRTTPGAFSRNSPNAIEGYVAVNAEDGIAELGETKLPASHAYNNDVAAYKLSYPTDESLSLMHLYPRLVTKHEIRNYSLNSSFENATIGNSWLNSGMSVFERSNTYAQFGTYSMKCTADTINDSVSQYVTFVGTDKIDVGDTFNLSMFIRQDTSQAIVVQLFEYFDTTSLSILDAVATGTDTNVFTRVNITHTIQGATCNRIRIRISAVATCTFYVDGVMLTRGIDSADYFLINSADGASGIGSADSAATYLYDTVAIDTEEVTLSHPYAIINKGDTVWEHIKDIGDATLARYIGMTADGVFKYATAYNETDPTALGAITDVSGISTGLDSNEVNSIKVEGMVIDKATENVVLWDGTGSLLRDAGGKVRHPIASGASLSVNGATTIEARYSEKAT